MVHPLGHVLRVILLGKNRILGSKQEKTALPKGLHTFSFAADQVSMLG